MLQYVVTSFKSAVDISVPLLGINPNCISWNSCVLLSVRTYISSMSDIVVDMTVGPHLFGTDESHPPAFFGTGIKRPLVKLSGTAPS